MSRKITVSITPEVYLAWALIVAGAVLALVDSIGIIRGNAGLGAVLVFLGKLVLDHHMLTRQTELQIQAFELGRVHGAREAGLRPVGR